jgi:hypothetical protein
MASAIAHPFIALALTPWFRRSGITPHIGCLGALCTIFPDVDVVGFHLGIPYDSLLGHRGMTHSVAFAAALAAVLTLGLRRVTPGVPVGPVFLFLALVDHALPVRPGGAGAVVGAVVGDPSVHCDFPAWPAPQGVAVSQKSLQRLRPFDPCVVRPDVPADGVVP